MLINNIKINKLRRCKRKLEIMNKQIIRYVDINSESFIDSDTLKQMTLISEIDEILTDVIYLIIDEEKAKN